MQGEGLERSFEERRLGRAIEHVSRHWLPCNPAVLKSVQAGLKEGRYELGPEFLVADLKGDVGLFSFCLREIMRNAKSKDPNLELADPQVLLAKVPRKDLEKILEQAERALSSHSLERVNDAQASQLRYTLVSTATAEVLAQHTQLDSEKAFLSALFRQLGLLLISWNYPTVFERTRRSVKENPAVKLDEELSRQLGFSPETLGHAILADFSPADEISNAVGMRTDTKPTEISESAKRMTELCRIGEALAQANEPENYPEAGAVWGAAKESISAILGDEGLKVIRESVERYSSAYREVTNRVFEGAVALDPDQALAKVERAELLGSNPYVDRCPLRLRQALIEFYAWRTTNRHPRDAVSRLLREVLPLSGFEAGAIFTLEPSTGELVPRLKFGSVLLRKIGNLRFGYQLTTDDAILAAMHASAPYVSRAEGRDRSFAVGALGEEPRYGVLYVEFAPQALDLEHTDPMVVFKAIQQSFHDALGIR